MDYVILGRTGLEVSVAGLGCGGHSRLGMAYGNSEKQSVELVATALDQGVNFIDTAAVYGTEEIVGKAISGKRSSVVVSTKQPVVPKGGDPLSTDLISASGFKQEFEKSLLRLNTDYVDILHLHGVAPNQYTQCIEELVPALYDLREQGKIRFLGLTERFIVDPGHVMLTQALKDDCWDVVMAGFNMINPSARERVFKATREKNIGTLIMFAVRRALSNPEELSSLVASLVEKGEVEADKVNLDEPFDFILQDRDATSIVEAAYRFCRHEPGVEVVLTGTGKVAHLAENVASITSGPLSAEHQKRLKNVFGKVDSVSGN
jgi:aryl-alcohol dehydrogenase-like predicted oxidoreductase